VEGGSNQGTDRPGASRRRLTVPKAAAALGVSVDAIRGRIKRGTIEHEREGDRVYVLVGADQPRPERDQGGDESALIVELRDRIRFLERQVEEERESRRRADTLLARMMDNIPALEASESHEEAAQEPAEGEARVHAAPGDTEAERPWWRRLFGG
jgi:hypothetical protein